MFTIAKKWKQPRCLSTDEEDVALIYHGIVLSHENKWNNAIYNNIDGPRDCQYWEKLSQKEKEK